MREQVSWEQIRRGRLARSHLLKPAPRTRLVDVVREVCGIQAQVMGAAELALSARVRGLTQEHVRNALWKHRTLAKTWTIRGTLHLHPADELPLWTAAARAASPPWHEGYGLTAKQGEKVLDAIGDALDGRALLREELADEVAQRAGEWTRERIGSGWGYIIGEAAAVGKLCHGPPRGNKVTFVRTDQWVGWRELNPEEALAEAACRFVAAYRPAGPREFAAWFGMKPQDARPLFDSIEPPTTRKRHPGPVRLLPEYDAYVMGSREREQLIPERVKEQVKAHNRGRYEGIAAVPALVIDGVVEGIWRRAKSAKTIDLEVEPTRRITADERRGIEDEAERIGSFLGVEPKLSVDRLSA
jgi:Winged helix DNA-binding domain